MTSSCTSSEPVDLGVSDVDVSVVIPLLNGERTLSEQLEALSKQRTRYSWEVVVADNGSTDGSRQVVESWRSHLPTIRLVDASTCRGVSHARNVGVREARARFVLICDADDVVCPVWIEEMREGLESADVVGGAFDEVTLNEAVSVAWRGERPRDRLPTALDFLPFAVGANVGLTKAVFDAIGGWDESYVGGGDDIDFSWRAQLRGFKVRLVPNAIVAYRHRSDLRHLQRQFYRYGKAGPKLYAQYRGYGAKRRPVSRALRSWIWIAVMASDLFRGPIRRGRYLRALAQVSGRAVGSIQNRVIYL